MRKSPQGASAPTAPASTVQPAPPEEEEEVLALHTRDLLLPELRPEDLPPGGDATLVTDAAALREGLAAGAQSGTTRLPLPGVRGDGGKRPVAASAPTQPRATQPLPSRGPEGRGAAAGSAGPAGSARPTAPMQPSATGNETLPMGLPLRGKAAAALAAALPAAGAAEGGEDETKKVSLRRLMPGQFHARSGYDSVGHLPVTGLVSLPGQAHPQETAAVVVVRRANQSLRGLLVGLLVLVTALSIAGSVLYVRQQQGADALADRGRLALQAAQQRGDAMSYVHARTALRDLAAMHPTDAPTQAALARVVSALRFEFGGHSSVPTLNDEAQAAGYLVQTETSVDARMAQAYLALLRGDGASAAQAAKALRGKAVDRGLSAYLLGLTALWNGDAAEAAEQLAAALRGAGEGASPLMHLWLARAQRELHKDDEARATLQALLRQVPDHPGARLELAWLMGLSGRGDRESHARTLRTLAQDATIGTGERARAQLGLAALALQPPALSLPAARAALQEARALLPAEDIGLAARLASLALRAREPDLAIVAMQAALERAPQREDLRLMLVRALLQRNRASEALAELDRLDAQKPGPGEAPAPADARLRERRLLRGATLLALDQTVPGQELLQALLQEDPRDPVASEARLFLLRSLQEDDLPLAQRLLAQLRESAGVAAEADALAALQAAQLQEVRLWLLAKPPRRDAALQALQALIDRAPYLVEARLQLGRLLRELRRPAEAAQQLREALKLDEENTAARREMLQAALSSNDAAAAQEQLDKLLHHEEDDELLLLAARTRRLQGDAAGAQGFLQRVKPGRGSVTAAQVKAERDALQRLPGAP